MQRHGALRDDLHVADNPLREHVRQRGHGHEQLRHLQQRVFDDRTKRLRRDLQRRQLHARLQRELHPVRRPVRRHADGQQQLRPVPGPVSGRSELRRRALYDNLRLTHDPLRKCVRRRIDRQRQLWLVQPHVLDGRPECDIELQRQWVVHDDVQLELRDLWEHLRRRTDGRQQLRRLFDRVLGESCLVGHLHHRLVHRYVRAWVCQLQSQRADRRVRGRHERRRAQLRRLQSRVLRRHSGVLGRDVRLGMLHEHAHALQRHVRRHDEQPGQLRRVLDAVHDEHGECHCDVQRQHVQRRVQ